jgi:hypothetical protein
MTYVPASGAKSPLAVILALGTTQTIAWASSYCIPAILAAPIARDLGVAPTYVFGALSGALVISGLLGPRIGDSIDTFGGRCAGYPKGRRPGIEALACRQLELQFDRRDAGASRARKRKGIDIGLVGSNPDGPEAAG